MKRNINRLVSLFKSAAEIGRIAGVHRTAVGRWEANDWQISDDIQIRLLEAAPEYGRSVGDVANCMGVRRCDCCNAPINPRIRELLEDYGDGRDGKTVEPVQRKAAKRREAQSAA